MNWRNQLSPRGRKRGRRAFTLVEILATISLMGITLPIMMEAVSVSMHCADMAHHRNEAAALAESQLNQIVVDGSWANNSSLGGKFQDWPDYQWSATVGQWTETGLMQIDVHVTWRDRDGNRDIVASTLVYNNFNAGSGASSSSTTGSTSGSGGGKGTGGGSGSKTGAGSGSGSTGGGGTAK